MHTCLVAFLIAAVSGGSLDETATFQRPVVGVEFVYVEGDPYWDALAGDTELFRGEVVRQFIADAQATYPFMTFAAVAPETSSVVQLRLAWDSGTDPQFSGVVLQIRHTGRVNEGLSVPVRGGAYLYRPVTRKFADEVGAAVRRKLATSPGQLVSDVLFYVPLCTAAHWMRPSTSFVLPFRTEHVAIAASSRFAMKVRVAGEPQDATCFGGIAAEPTEDTVLPERYRDKTQIALDDPLDLPARFRRARDVRLRSVHLYTFAVRPSLDPIPPQTFDPTLGKRQ